jgi:predicted O-methyltransferase YrrM
VGLATPVPLVQDAWEFAQLLDVFRSRDPRRVLEVGTYAGGTLYHWLQNASPGTHVVSVDFYTQADNRKLYDGWCGPGVGWAAVAGDSNDPAVAALVAEWDPYDFVFVDAGHLEENIRADVDLYLPMTRKGSVVAFHDIEEHEGLPNVQVWRVWRELRQEYRTVEFVAPGGMGIGVLLP